MYRYDEFDHAMVRDRVDQFEDQVARRLSGEITEDEFKPLRLQNGVYLQLHAYMLRVAIPYGQLSSRQMRMLAHIARTYDKGYGHFTTRQNIQYNWPKLVDIPAILSDLASVEMHAIQTSGNCIRNVTSDHFAGASADEIEDPRPWCELIRQWSTFHPEFAYLPRKFKIAVTAAETDRAAVRVHDIGLHMRQKGNGEIGVEVIVGGGQGRTPHVGHTIQDFLPKDQLISYLEAIMRTYNRFGRRDNKYKARIKILVNELGPEAFKDEVDAEWAEILKEPFEVNVPRSELDRIVDYFALPAFKESDTVVPASDRKGYDLWIASNTHDHKDPSHVSVTVSLKPVGGAPGDASADQMDLMADLAQRFGYDDVRVTHEQNIVYPHVAKSDLPALYDALDEAGLGTPNAGLVSDMICCPGLDYCNLANTRSIPIAQDISESFSDMEEARDIGELKIKISGCINACGHHHVGHIGILGVDKKGEEFFQITLGGRADEKASIGKIAGPALKREDIPDAIRTLVKEYKSLRKHADERFIDTVERLGTTPFQEALYAD